MDLVVDQVMELEHVHDADRNRLIEAHEDRPCVAINSR